MTHKFPLIGIPCWLDAGEANSGRVINAMSNTYVDAVLQAGGLPVLIPLQVQGETLEEIFRRVDGLLFSGGGDIDPVFYAETLQVNNLIEVQPERDRLEIRLMQMAMQSRKPFLAICRGIQVMNVANGGSLWQDIAGQKPGAIRHNCDCQDKYPWDYLAHEVNLEASSLLGRLLHTDRLPANSLHHQGIKAVAPSLKAVGYADDGLVEALEALDHPFGLGVQWHPEELVASQEAAAARQIFAAFVEAARQETKPYA